MNEFLILVALVFLLWGLFLLLFRKGKRRRGLLVAVVALGVIGWTGDKIVDDQAIALGFTSFEDRLEAKEAGITSPSEWNIRRDEIQTAKIAEAEKALEAKKAAEEETRILEERRIAEEAAQKDKDRAHGFHCLSAWDGSHPALVRAVEEQLNDPDSFDHVETVTWPVRPDGQNAIRMTFRAKNGFGGVITTSATATFDNEKCDVATVAIASQ